MSKNNSKYEERGYFLIKIPSNTDSRGTLAFTEWKHLPFSVERIFWIYDVAEGKTRGGHAHSKCAEIVFAVHGSFDMFVDNGKEQEVFHIDTPDTGIYIGPNVWCELRNFAPGTVCVALASMPYDSTGYINSKDEFNKIHSK
ncbi:MAG: FdtA/QdtA family cupin domain-containing protein [Bacteroidaceae bacterium]|nr:FdtA/QdtA family cupin domain-containing protein [Bacteroidaceae bacterium]